MLELAKNGVKNQGQRTIIQNSLNYCMLFRYLCRKEEPHSSRYEPPPRLIPPNGVQDFDLENWKDPSQCSEYVQDIFQYYKNREVSDFLRFNRSFFTWGNHCCNKDTLTYNLYV